MFLIAAHTADCVYLPRAEAAGEGDDGRPPALDVERFEILPARLWPLACPAILALKHPLLGALEAQDELLAATAAAFCLLFLLALLLVLAGDAPARPDPAGPGPAFHRTAGGQTDRLTPRC